MAHKQRYPVRGNILVSNIVNDTRPVNLDLSTIKLPITAITSILTRISGVINFVSAGIMLYLLDMSLSSPQGFAEVKSLLDAPLVKLIVWGMQGIGFREQELTTWLMQYPDAHSVRFEDVGHYVQEEAPERLIRSIEDFLSISRI